MWTCFINDRRSGGHHISFSCFETCVYHPAPVFTWALNFSIDLCEVAFCLMTIITSHSIRSLNDNQPTALTFVAMATFLWLVLMHLKDIMEHFLLEDKANSSLDNEVNMVFISSCIKSTTQSYMQRSLGFVYFSSEFNTITQQTHSIMHIPNHLSMAWVSGYGELPSDPLKIMSGVPLGCVIVPLHLHRPKVS